MKVYCKDCMYLRSCRGNEYIASSAYCMAPETRIITEAHDTMDAVWGIIHHPVHIGWKSPDPREINKDMNCKWYKAGNRKDAEWYKDAGLGRD